MVENEMNITNKDLKRRIVDISYRHKLSHLGSCLTAVDIIDEIYRIKKPDERFVLSQGHAGLALYAVIEKYLGVDAEKIYDHHGTHPDKCKECHLDCSTGSLGQGLPIAVGMALANREKNVYCLISDGECAEGSIWEALHFIEDNLNPLTNLYVYLNLNLWGAYRRIEGASLFRRIEQIGLKVKNRVEIVYTEKQMEQLPFLKGLDAHYRVMSEDDYKVAMEVLQ